MSWTFLVNCHDELEASIITGILKEEGIAFQTKYRGMGDYLKVITGMGKDVDILVATEQYLRAKELLTAFEEEPEQEGQ